MIDKDKDYICPTCQTLTSQYICPKCKKDGKLIPTFCKNYYNESRKKYSAYYE